MSTDFRCPGCDLVGDLSARVSLFTERGLSDAGEQVIRCGNCGCGFALAARGLLRKKTREELIDPDAWARMEQIWERNHPLPATTAAPLPDPRQLAAEMTAAGLTGPHATHRLAEAAELPEDEARRLLVAAQHGDT